MRSIRLLTFAAAASLALGCGESTVRVTPGQILLYVDTDAPVPSEPGEPVSLALPLFDRLRIEVYPPGATSPCDGCTNDFQISSGAFAAGQVSVGVAPVLGVSGYAARARLYLQGFAGASGDPDPDSTIDVTALLPTVSSNTIVQATLQLMMADVGQPVGSLTAPVPVSPGPVAQSLVGTWSGAQRPNCTGAAPVGTVCVPGGAYWMGNPNAPGMATGGYTIGYVPEPRLIVLSPFFMAATEVTVREFRASGLVPEKVWDQGSTGVSALDFCTFTASPGPFDDLPVNCLSQTQARAYCQMKGADLPTEAQFEYAQGGLSDSVFPWGGDEPACSDAVYGRGADIKYVIVVSSCPPSAPPGSPAVPGSGVRDRLDLLGGSIVDLAGNVTEWSRDLWNRIDEPCWERPGIYQDPLCTTVSPNDGEQFVLRGGNWVSEARNLEATARLSFPPTTWNPQVGLRCVWPSG